MSKDIKRFIIIYFCGLGLILLGHITQHIILLFITYSIGYVWGLLTRKSDNNDI